MTDNLTEADWERVLSAAAFVQQLFPDAILVGGTASSLHAHHRYSLDDDHVIAQLKDRFEQALNDIEHAAGWKTARIVPPVLILGRLNGVDTGIRNLIRSAPLETTRIATVAGELLVPTMAEMLRIKAWLIVTRNATRDYIDTVALADTLGQQQAADALEPLDAFYPQPLASTKQQLIKQLAQPEPYDRTTDLRIYRALRPPYDDMTYICERAAALAESLLLARDRTSDRGPAY